MEESFIRVPKSTDLHRDAIMRCRCITFRHHMFGELPQVELTIVILPDGLARRHYAMVCHLRTLSDALP